MSRIYNLVSMQLLFCVKMAADEHDLANFIEKVDEIGNFSTNSHIF